MEQHNPLYPIVVEGWRGAIRQDELAALDPQSAVELLVESAFPPPPARQPYPSLEEAA